MSRSADGCGDGCEVKQRCACTLLSRWELFPARSSRPWTHLFHFVCGERVRAKQWRAWTPMFCWELFSASYLRPWTRLFHLVRSERGQEKIHEVEAKRLGETKACVHAFISLGAASVKPLRPWTPMFHPACRATGWTARARQGVFLVRVSCGKCPPAPSTASDAKWFLVQSMRWTIRNSIALTSSRREFRIGCGIIHVKRINRTASGNKIRI